MGQRISDGLYRVSTGRVVLAALVVFLLFSALVLPRQATADRRYSSTETGAGDVGSPDTSLYYSRDELYRMAEAYGAQGRAAYVRARLTFDVIWPMVYTLFLSTAISWLYARAFEPGSSWRRANLVPVLGALFDYLENLSTSLVMLRYPDHTPVVDALAPIFTLIKWIFVGGSFALLLTGLAVGAWRWIRSRSDS
jgi:hypothetical protein